MDKEYKKLNIKTSDFEKFDLFCKEKKIRKNEAFSDMIDFYFDNYDVAKNTKKVRSGKLNLNKDEKEIQKMIKKEIQNLIGFIKQQDKFMYIYRNEILWKIDNNSNDVEHPMQMHYIILYEYLVLIIEHFGINKNEIDQWIKKNISVSDALQFQESLELSQTMKIFK